MPLNNEEYFTLCMENTTHQNIPQNRLIPRSESERIETIKLGEKPKGWSDLYVRLLDASWKWLLVLIIVSYLVINLLFAGIYITIPGGIENARNASFLDAFFFSVQTLATIGYGKMAPQGLLANILVTIEALTGFSFYAVVTGLMFSKFSRPTARVLFSNVAVITPYNGTPHLMLRLANERGNRIVDAHLDLVLIQREVTSEGHQMRRFYDLPLTRERVPLLQLTWTAMHPITPDSPLYQATSELLHNNEVEIIVSLSGVDETLSQPIYARYSYIAKEILCGAHFKDIIRRTENNLTEIDFRLFHDVDFTKKI